MARAYRALSVDDALDIYSSPALATLVEDAVPQADLIVVDLSKCEYIDSVSVHTIVKICAAQPASVVIPEDAPIRRALTITGAIERMPVAPTFDEAVKKLREPERRRHGRANSSPSP